MIDTLARAWRRSIFALVTGNMNHEIFNSQWINVRPQLAQAALFSHKIEKGFFSQNLKRFFSTLGLITTSGVSLLKNAVNDLRIFNAGILLQ